MNEIKDVNDLLKQSANFDKDFRSLKENAKEINLELDDDWNEEETYHQKPIESFALSLTDFMAGTSDVEWLWEGILAKPSLGILAAKPKFGKTLLTFNLAIAASQGSEYLGRTVEKTNVLIIQLEDPPVIIRNRLQKMNANGDGLFIRAGLPMDKNDWKTLAEFITEKEIGLTIVDPFIFAIRGNEQDATATGVFLRKIRELIFSTNCSVLLVHHHRKSPGEHGDAIRGSSAILGAVDVALELMREDENDPSATLKITSRFACVEPEVILLNADKLTWDSQGSAKNYKQLKREQEILKALSDKSEMDAADLEEYLGISVRRFRDDLKRLVENGLVNERKQATKGRPSYLYSIPIKDFSAKSEHESAENFKQSEQEKHDQKDLFGRNSNPRVTENAEKFSNVTKAQAIEQLKQQFNAEIVEEEEPF